MKVSTILAVIVPAMLVTAIPVAEPVAVADANAAPVEVEARDLTRGQCKAACDQGAEAVERFCRLIPEPRIRFFCWGAATAAESPLGQRACTAFCDAWF